MAEDAPFVCYKEILPPLSVHIASFFCVKAINEQRLHLCTASVSCLTIYKIVHRKDDRDPQTTVLSLKTNVRLFGRVSDLKCYKSSGSSDLLAVILDEGLKLVVLEYDPLSNSLHTLLMSDISRISTPEIMGYGNSIDLGYSCVNTLGSEGSIAVFSNVSDGTVSLHEIPVRPLTIACSVLYGHCLLFTLLPSSSLLPTERTEHPHRTDPGKQQYVHDMKQQLTYSLNPLTLHAGGSAAASYGVHGPILDISFLPRRSSGGFNGFTARPTLVVLQQAALVPIGHMASSNDKVTNTAVITVLAVDADVHAEGNSSIHIDGSMITEVEPKKEGIEAMKALKLRLNSVSVLWQQDRLPSNSIAALPFPQYSKTLVGASGRNSFGPLYGSVVVITMNAILVVTEESVFGVACNGFASVSVASHVSLQPFQEAFVADNELDAGIELDGSKWIFEEPEKSGGDAFSVDWIYGLIGTLKDGRIIRTHVVCSDGAISAHCRYLSYFVRFFIEEVAQSIRCRCLSSTRLADAPDSQSTDYLWFVGSSHGDSLLMRAKCNQPDKSEDSLVSLGKRKVAAISDFSEPNTLGKTEEELLYGVSLIEHSANSKDVKWSQIEIFVDDFVPNIGPIVDGFFSGRGDDLLNEVNDLDWDRSQTLEASLLRKASGKTNSASPGAILDKESKVSLQLCAGIDEQASIVRVYNGWSFQKVVSQLFVGACGVQSVSVHSSPSTFNILLVSTDSSTRILHAAENISEEDGNANGDFEELKFKEIGGVDSGFIFDSPTIFAGTVAPGFVVQVFGRGARLIRLAGDFHSESDALQDILLSDGVDIGGLGGDADEAIISGDVNNGFVRDDRSDRRTNPAVVSPSRDTEGNNVTSPNLNTVFTSSIISASLFYGSLKTPSSTQLSATYLRHGPKNNRTFSPSEAEEFYLYGAPLYNLVEEEEESSAVGHIEGVEDQHPDGGDSHVFLVTTEVDGTLRVIRLHDLVCVLSTVGFSNLDSFVPVPQQHLSLAESAAPRLIIEARFVKLRRKGHEDDEGAVLCLALVFSSGDLAVYTAFIERDIIYSFNLSDFASINNYRKSAAKVKLHRGLSSDYSNGPTPRSNSSNQSNQMDIAGVLSDIGGFIDADFYLKSSEYTNRLGFSLNVIDELDGHNALLISCNNPLLLFCCHGMPQLLPMGFPETPYINCGQQIVVPCTIGRFQGVATLWYEHEDIESLRQPGGTPRAVKRASLTLYHSVPALGLFPGASVSVNRVHVGKTVHKFRDLEKRTDDKTEQILLEKKTYLLSCSEEQHVPFPDDLTTQEELENEDIYLERYLPILASFSTAASDLGPAPPLKERIHSIVLSQGGAIVDKYALPANERVIDVTVLYFSLMRPQPTRGPGAFPTMTIEKRVFVAACTSIADKRGEDTQGNGRLLFFGLDYGLFHELQQQAEVTDTERSTSVAVIPPVDNAGNNNSAKEMDITVSAETESGPITEFVDRIAAPQAAAANPTDSVRKVSFASDTKNPESLSSAANLSQDSFLKAITPKLQLLWSGPGPASVVKQLGEFLLSTVGATVFVYKINPSTLELEQVSFYFAQFYITSVSVIKNYVLLADMFHSVHLLFWRAGDFSLNLVSKDYDNRIYLSTAFLIDGNKLGIVSGDDEGNMQILQENTRKMESIKGTRLLCLADFHVGSDVSLLLSHDLLSSDSIRKTAADTRPPPPPPRTRKGSSFPLQTFGTRLNKTNSTRTGVLVGTMDGGLGLLIPLDERIYRRLLLLQQIMAMIVPSPLHLNHRDYRLFKSKKFRIFKKKGVLDGCLLWRYNALHPQLQEELAFIVGVTSYAIRENLHDIDCLTNFF